MHSGTSAEAGPAFPSRVISLTASSHHRAGWTPIWFLAPALAITAAVVLVPVAQTAWLSLQDYLLYDPDAATFVGSRNFSAILRDEVFWISLWHSVIWIIGVVGLQFLLGLATALLLNQSFWWRGAARALVVVPWALPSVIIGLMWTWMYDFNVGVFNDMLVRGGFIDAPIAWLARPDIGSLCDHARADLAGVSVLCRDDPGGITDDPVGVL